MTAVLARALAVVVASSAGWTDRPWTRTPRPVRPPAHRTPPMRAAVASWYALDGPGACGNGAQTGLHFASLILACRTQIRICHAGCVTATMADHGPYVAGRTFDLNINLRDAIRCPDICSVRWRRAEGG